MIATIDGQVFTGKRLRSLLDITGPTHFKSIKINNKWPKTQVRWGIGVPEKAGKTRGETLGDQEIEMSLEVPQAFWGQMERNFALAYGEDIQKSSIPMVMTVIMEGNSPDPVERIATAQTWVLEFTISGVEGIGGEMGSTDENIISLTCNVVSDPFRAVGPLQTGGF